jgi:tripartite-type tricarboxylate transporter receptor subunit TctC
VQQEVAKVLALPDVRASLDASGRLPLASTPTALGTMVRDALPKWRELVRVAALKPE